MRFDIASEKKSVGSHLVPLVYTALRRLQLGIQTNLLSFDEFFSFLPPHLIAAPCSSPYSASIGKCKK